MMPRWGRAGAVLALGMLWSCGSSNTTNYGAGGSGGTLLGGNGGDGGQGSCLAAGTLNVTASGTTAYVIDGHDNPSLTLCRGNTYLFSINTPGHPFYINTVQGTGTANAYDSGVAGNGTMTGILTFVVPADAPATLYYNCSIHPAMTGVIHVVD